MFRKIEDNDKRIWFGYFQVGSKTFFGELTIDQQNSNLYLQSEEEFSLNPDNQTILGELLDKRSVLLVNCNVPPFCGSVSISKDYRYYFTNIFPHYIVISRDKILNSTNLVSKISWTMEDTVLVFYDFDAFGTAMIPENHISAIIEEREQKLERLHKIGKQPIVQYFTGKTDILSCDIGFGTLRIDHGLSYGLGGPKGTNLSSEIFTSIEFHHPIDFNKAIEYATIITNFFGIVCGRPQSLDDICLKFDNISEKKFMCPLYTSFSLKRKEIDKSLFDLGPRDALLNGMDRSDEFSHVLKYWIKTNDSMKHTRNRFLEFIKN